MQNLMRQQLFRQYIIKFFQMLIFPGFLHISPSFPVLFFNSLLCTKPHEQSKLNYHTLHRLQMTSRTMCRPVIIVRNCISEYSMLTTRSKRKAGPVDPEKPLNYEIKDYPATRYLTYRLHFERKKKTSLYLRNTQAYLNFSILAIR